MKEPYIPYPIPSPAREDLIRAGQAACALRLGTPERAAASVQVRKVLLGILFRYGVE